MLVILIIENKLGVDNVREIARTMRDAHVKVVLWAGGGDMSLSYGHDEKLTQAGLDQVIAAGKEFGLPVGINGTTDFQRRYDQGVRVFFRSGRRLKADARPPGPRARANLACLTALTYYRRSVTAFGDPNGVRNHLVCQNRGFSAQKDRNPLVARGRSAGPQIATSSRQAPSPLRETSVQTRHDIDRRPPANRCGDPTRRGYCDDI